MAVVVVCLCALMARGAFVNEGFETGDFTGWTVGGNAEHGVGFDGDAISGTSVSGNYVKARSGGQAAWVKLSTTDPETTFSLEQTVPVTAGQKYEWGSSIGMFSDPPVAGAQFGLRRWINGALFSSGTSSVGSGFFTFTTGYTAPAGATNTTFKFEWTGNVAGGSMAGFSIDDVYFRAVPEPGTITGVGILAFAFLVHRRVKFN